MPAPDTPSAEAPPAGTAAGESFAGEGAADTRIEDVVADLVDATSPFAAVDNDRSVIGQMTREAVLSVHVGREDKT